jgi:hypothetical protein
MGGVARNQHPGKRQRAESSRTLMASYEAVVTPTAGNVIDGDLRRTAKVSLLRFETPTGKPVKAGSTTVRAWTKHGLAHAADTAAHNLMNVDKARRRSEIAATIERLEAAERVSLKKGK